MGNGLIRAVGGVAIGTIVIAGTLNYTKQKIKSNEITDMQIQMIAKNDSTAAKRVVKLESRYDINDFQYQKVLDDVFVAETPEKRKAILDSAYKALNETSPAVKIGKLFCWFK